MGQHNAGERVKTWHPNMSVSVVAKVKGQSIIEWNNNKEKKQDYTSRFGHPAQWARTGASSEHFHTYVGRGRVPINQPLESACGAARGF